MATARQFAIDESIDVPASDIELTWLAGKLTLTLYFSRVVGGLSRDLVLSFDEALAFQWEDEIFGYIPSPSQLPKCTNPEFRSWTHSILLIDGSDWAAEYSGRFPQREVDHPVAHYYFVAMNDLIHVLSMEPPTKTWIAPAT